MKSTTVRKIGLGMAMCLGGLFAASQSFAQSYPDKPVRLIVTWPAGGATDVLARKVGQMLFERLRQPLVVENRAGATGIIGTEAAARAPADGYTLLFASSEHALNQAYHRNLKFDGVRDFAPVASVARQPLVIISGAGGKFSTLQDLVGKSKSSPGQFTYGSWGLGSLSHFSMELVKAQTGADLLHVPYQGAAPALNGVIGGQVDTMMSSFVSVGKLHAAGKVNILAVSAPKRSAAYPDVPTFAELGFPNVVAGQWFGVFAPAGTPPQIVDRVATEVAAVVRSADMTQWMSSMGLDPFPGGPAEFRSFVEAEVARWTRLMRDAQIAPK